MVRWALRTEPRKRPTEPKATYDWVDAADAVPAEPTPLDNLIRSATGGGTNFAEWYFPTRLLLDLGAVGGAAVPVDGWQAALGLRAFDGPRIDAPILSVAADLFTDSMAAVAGRVAPAVGGGRPHAGADRASPEGFATVDATHLGHLDVVLAADGPLNPVPAAVVDFLIAHSEAGSGLELPGTLVGD